MSSLSAPVLAQQAVRRSPSDSSSSPSKAYDTAQVPGVSGASAPANVQDVVAESDAEMEDDDEGGWGPGVLQVLSALGWNESGSGPGMGLWLLGLPACLCLWPCLSWLQMLGPDLLLPLLLLQL